MEYAPQGPRLPINSRSQVDSRSQPEPSHRTNPRSRAGRRPAANPWPQDNPIPNRVETVYAVPRSNRNAAHARRVEITIPQHAATQHRSMQAQIADPLPEVAEVKARLSRYWEPMAEYGPPSTTDSKKSYRRTRRLLGPFGDMPDAMPASRTPSPPRPKRAKGKGRQLRLDTQQHQQCVGGRKEHGGQWSPDSLRIQAIEARLVDRGRDRRYQEGWNQGIKR